MLDAGVFDALRRGRGWWQAPLVSSLVGSTIDTAIFFSLAFAPEFAFLGANDDFAIEAAPMFGVLAMEVPRFVSWAVADFAVKTVFALMMLAPYRGLSAVIEPERA